MIINNSPSNHRLLSLRQIVLKNKATKEELYVKELLNGIKEDFCFQKGFFTSNKHFIVDFYFKRRKKLCLEIDGGYHDNPEQMAYDCRRDYFLTAIRGFRVKRITNDDAMRLNANSLLELISA